MDGASVCCYIEYGEREEERENKFAWFHDNVFEEEEKEEQIGVIHHIDRHTCAYQHYYDELPEQQLKMNVRRRRKN